MKPSKTSLELLKQNLSGAAKATLSFLWIDYNDSDGLITNQQIEFTCSQQQPSKLPSNQNPQLWQYTVLSYYFPSAKQDQLLLDTRYYRANIQVQHSNWPQAQEIVVMDEETLQQPNKNADNQALMIMLVGQSEAFPAAMYDYVVSKYNPENFILIVNTKHRQLAWPDEEKIKNEVNNFIEIIKEDLEDLCKNPPERVKTGLLADVYEDGNFFNLLELMETTSWPHIKRKVLSHNNKEKSAEETEQILSNVLNAPKQEQKPEKIQPQEQEMTDEQLENELKSFELMMSQMHSLKMKTNQFQGISDNQRKLRAEDLISKLLGGHL